MKVFLANLVGVFQDAPRLGSSWNGEVILGVAYILTLYNRLVSKTPAWGIDANVSARTTFSPPELSSLGNPNIS